MDFKTSPDLPLRRASPEKSSLEGGLWTHTVHWTRQLGGSEVTETKLAIMSAWNVKQGSDLIPVHKQEAGTLRVSVFLGKHYNWGLWSLGWLPY